MSLGFTEDQVQRYSRHIILPNIGGAGQRKLLDSKVLVIGAGGLGSPILLYLAAAGIGTIGIVDFDKVDTSNLQRQILHTDADVDRPKVASALDHLRALNPTIELIGHDTLLSSENVMEIMEPYDVVIDGTDNFPVRYLVNDATQFLRKPLVYGSIYQFEGQATVFLPGQETPCYRCLFPAPPPPGTVPSCAEGGVFGVLPGVIGAIQATEAIKLITGEGESLVTEIRRGSVSRTITLPTGLEPDKASATYEHGMLKLRIPKAEAVKPRQIRITPTTDRSSTHGSNGSKRLANGEVSAKTAVPAGA
jgi:adenylyltransferase/sulfurtransferase